MSIASALTNLQADITAARTAVTNKGGTVTEGGGSSQLATDIGTIRSLRKETGTVTPVSDNRSVTIETGLTDLQEISVLAETDDPSTLPVNTILKVCGVKTGETDYQSGDLTSGVLSGINNACGGGIYVYSAGTFSSAYIYVTFSGGSVELHPASTARVFRAGQTYRWIAYGWEDTQ